MPPPDFLTLELYINHELINRTTIVLVGPATNKVKVVWIGEGVSLGGIYTQTLQQSCTAATVV